MIEALLALSLLAQPVPPLPKSISDVERLNDKVNASREYDSNARTILSRNFAEAIETYTPNASTDLVPSWGEFIAVDGMPFIALQLAIPGNAPDAVTFFGRVVDESGKTLATYNEKLNVQISGSDRLVERSLLIPLVKSTGTFGIARGSEILGVTRIAFDPESVTKAAPAVSRLILSSDVHVLPEAQKPRDPFAFGGTKVVPKPGTVFRRAEPVWIFAELRNPSLAPDGTPHVTTKLSIVPSKISGPPAPAEVTPLKGMPGHYGIGNPIDIATLAPGDYTLRVVFTDLVSRQTFTREAALHIRE